MVWSKYNVLVLKDKTYLFNTYTKALAEIEEEIKDAILNDTTIIDKDDVVSFLDNGFLVKSHSSELNQIRRDFEKTISCESLMYLSIMPTLKCNFRCTYCFEHHCDKEMDTDTLQSLISFLSEILRKGQIKALKVDWYGGEPLLRQDIIWSFSKEMVNLCSKFNVSYYSSMTTNASLLDQDAIILLRKCKVSSLQITIDGPKKIHDNRRIGINGQGTFDAIINAIHHAISSFDITIRVNIDATNAPFIDSLLFFLHNYGLKKVGISFKGVVSSSERDVSNTQLPDSDLASLIYQKNVLAYKLGFDIAILDYFNNLPSRFCIVDCINQFIISPDGKLFKCGESFDSFDPGYVGVISNGKMHLETKKINYWRKNPFEDSNCLQCRLLPLCYGGCQLKRNVKGVSPCNNDLKHHLVDYLSLYIDSLVGKNEKEQLHYQHPSQ